MTRHSIAATVLLALSLQAGCRAEAPWPLWDQYTQRFVDGQGRVIDRSHEDRTTSEGQAYAMFFALVANDRPRFESLLRWTEANLAGGDLTLHLPAWSWGRRADGSWQVLDANSASDADLWMAYALLEAGRLWQDQRYAKLGGLIAARIAREEVVEVPGFGTTLLPGPQGFHPSPATWVLNPSYMPVPVLEYLAKTVPDGPWGGVLQSLGELLRRGSGGGYAMDWVTADADGVHPAANPGQAGSGATPVGSYDAIRVYLWLGIADSGAPDVHRLMASLPAMAGYLQGNGAPPRVIDATGKVLDNQGTVGFSAAVIPYLTAYHLKPQAAAQMDRLTAMKDSATGLYGHEAAYYDQNLALFATGWGEQKYRFDHDGRLKVKWKSK